jgi:hypothetical protein
LAFLKLLLAFAPWLAFLIIASNSLLRLKIGLLVALVLSVGMGVTRLHRGVILWSGLAFFTCTTIAVVGFNDMWTARHMGVLANGMLAISSWLTVAIGKPFSLDYARAHADPAVWNQPAFIRTNVIITSVWATVFVANALLAWGKMESLLFPQWGYEAVSYSMLIGAAAFTTWYPTHARRAREAAEQVASGGAAAGM